MSTMLRAEWAASGRPRSRLRCQREPRRPADRSPSVFADSDRSPSHRPEPASSECGRAFAAPNELLQRAFDGREYVRSPLRRSASSSSLLVKHKICTFHTHPSSENPVPSSRGKRPSDSESTAPPATSYQQSPWPTLSRPRPITTCSTRIRAPSPPRSSWWRPRWCRSTFASAEPDQDAVRRRRPAPAPASSAADGLILTNSHVVEHAAELSVVLPDGRELGANLLGQDPDTDVAVLRISAPESDRRGVRESQAAAARELVIAIGNPYGFHSP